MPTPIEVPPLGESITQAVLVAWKKNDGDAVALDEAVAELETDKTNVDLTAKAAGVLRRTKNVGDTVAVGEAIGTIEDGAGSPAPAPAPQAAAGAAPSKGAAPPAPAPAAPAAPAVPEDFSPAVRRLLDEHKLDPKSIPPTGPGGRLTKEDVEGYLAKQREAPERPRPANVDAPPAGALRQPPPPEKPAAQPARAPAAAKEAAPAPAPAGEAGALAFDDRGEARVPMTKIRRRIAETLVKAQHTAAILTTFNEVDLTEVMALRSKFKDPFEKAHGVGLGFMSFFTRAVVLALREVPRLNGSIDGDDVVYHRDVNLGIAVSTERGLAVPVLRRVQEMSFARIEAEIKRLAAATRDGKLSPEELGGATFSITNGGVFGSLLSTPILTPPQSGILGMHTIQKRPVVVNDQVVVRSMMYVALSYDHRLVDGKEAITFLVRMKQYLEDPARMVLEV